MVVLQAIDGKLYGYYGTVWTITMYDGCYHIKPDEQRPNYKVAFKEMLKIGLPGPVPSITQYLWVYDPTAPTAKEVLVDHFLDRKLVYSHSRDGDPSTNIAIIMRFLANLGDSSFTLKNLVNVANVLLGEKFPANSFAKFEQALIDWLGKNGAYPLCPDSSTSYYAKEVITVLKEHGNWDPFMSTVMALVQGTLGELIIVEKPVTAIAEEFKFIDSNLAVYQPVPIRDDAVFTIRRNGGSSTLHFRLIGKRQAVIAYNKRIIGPQDIDKLDSLIIELLGIGNLGEVSLTKESDRGEGILYKAATASSTKRIWGTARAKKTALDKVVVAFASVDPDFRLHATKSVDRITKPKLLTLAREFAAHGFDVPTARATPAAQLKTAVAMVIDEIADKAVEQIIKSLRPHLNVGMTALAEHGYMHYTDELEPVLSKLFSALDKEEPVTERRIASMDIVAADVHKFLPAWLDASRMLIANTVVAKLCKIDWFVERPLIPSCLANHAARYSNHVAGAYVAGYGRYQCAVEEWPCAT